MDEQLRQFMKQGLGIRQVLQVVEDALIEAGQGEIVVATERGTWQWMTTERNRARSADED